MRRATPVLLALAACLPAPRQLPPLRDPSQAATVTVLRARSFVSSAVGSKVVLDGVHVANLMIGEYVTFRVDPGVHAIGTADGSVALPMAAGGRYYLLINIAPSGAYEIERIEEAEARDRLRDYDEVRLRDAESGA